MASSSSNVSCLGYTNRHIPIKNGNRPTPFDLLVRSYIDKFGERGDTDFTTVSGHIVSLFRRKPGDTAAQRLKLALLMRNTYTDIFRHLI